MLFGLLIGLLVAAPLWLSGQRVWAVIAAVLCLLGWKVLWTLVSIPFTASSRTRRADVLEFKAATDDAGVFDLLSAEQLHQGITAWRRVKADTGVSAREFVRQMYGR